MRFLRSSTAAAVLSLLLSSSSGATALDIGDNCLGDGETESYCWTIDLTAPGNVVGTTIVPGSVEGHEYDWGTDDDLGSGTLDGDQICITLTNNGGQISGPNGVNQSGGSEGCLEVYLSYEVRWQVQHCSGGSTGATIGITIVGTGGTVGTGSTGPTQCWLEWHGETRTTGTELVCACN